MGDKSPKAKQKSNKQHTDDKNQKKDAAAQKASSTGNPNAKKTK